MQLRELKEIQVALPENNLAGDGLPTMVSDFAGVVDPRLLGNPADDEESIPTAQVLRDSVGKFIGVFAPKKSERLSELPELSEKLGSRGREQLAKLSEGTEEEAAGVSTLMRKNIGIIAEIVGVLVQGRINAVLKGPDRRIEISELTQILETLLTSITIRDISRDFRQFVLEISPEFQVLVNVNDVTQKGHGEDTFGPIMSVKQIAEELSDIYQARIRFVLN